MTFEHERRNSCRIQYNRQATLNFDTEVFEKYWIRNLSLSGMFVCGNFQQNVGEHCIVTLFQEGKYSYLSLEISAQIVRKEEHGIALAFTSMPLESLLPLQMILSCEDESKSINRGIASLDNLPFTVHDDLLR